MVVLLFKLISAWLRARLPAHPAAMSYKKAALNGNHIQRVVQTAIGALKGADGSPVVACSIYALPPVDGRPLWVVSELIAEGGFDAYIDASYANGALRTADGRMIYAIYPVDAVGVATSLSGGAAVAPSNSVAPVIAGGAVDGQTIYLSTAGTWTGSPAPTLTYELYDVTDLATVITTDTAYQLLDTDVGKSFKWKEIATNASGTVSVYSNTIGAVVEIDLSADAPVLTRTSSSGAQPVTWTSAYGSKTYAGYQVRLQVSAASDFSTLLYEGLIFLTEAMISSLSVPWSTDGSPLLSQSGWPTQVYIRERIETASPFGFDFQSSWSTSIRATDSAWSPTDLGSKLLAWYKADTLAGADTSSITTWPDSSGNGNDATASGNSPTVKAAGLNGLKTAKFDAASAQSLIAPTTLMNGKTQAAAFVVMKLVASPPLTVAKTGPALGDWGFTTTDHTPYTDSDWYVGWGYTGRHDNIPVPNSTAFRIIGFRTKANDWRCDVNGTNVYTTATNTVGWDTHPKIGKSASSSNYLDGEIPEIIITSDFLTTSEKQQVEGYLAWKWGSALVALLDVTHPYKSAAP